MSPCLAQRYSFREYTEGLGNLNITSLTQDRVGYLWVGTQNGLYRYDGSQFKRYGATEGIPDRIIDDVFVGLDGTIWVGTAAGIYFERRDGNFAAVQLPLPLNQFAHPTGTTFTSNRPDQVLTVTNSRGLLLQRLDTDKWSAKPLNLEGGFIWSMVYGPDGSLWYGCDKDLCRLNDGKTTQMRAQLGLPEEQWRSLLVARNGHIWLRGNLHVVELPPDASAFQLRDIPGPSISEPYAALAEDAQGRVLTSDGSSLALWEKDHWRMVTEQNGLSPFELQNLFVDREGSVWMGIVGHGLLRWVGEDSWEAYTASDGLSDNLVWAAMRDRQGRLWIGTESGLNWIPAGKNTPKAWRSPGVPTSRAGSLAVSDDGAIWMGSMAGSLTRIDPITLDGKQYKMPAVYGIVSDGPNRIWVATMSGIFQIDPASRDRQAQLVDDPAFPSAHQRFTDLTRDPAGHLYTTSDQGLFEHDETGWHRIDPGQSGAKPDIIAVDRKGNLWVAGPSQDLLRLRVSGYRVVEAEHIGRPPLMSEEIVSLVVDHRGWLWVGEDAGVTVYDGQRWRSFTQDDGLIWNDTDSFALAEDRDGSMWIGTSGGLSHLITPQTALAASPPPPAFSQVTLGTVPISDGGSVQWSSNPLTISMALLSFKDTQDIGIRYRLVGEQGGGWEETREMTVRFRHLPPGNYRFEVAAVNAAGSTVSPVARRTPGLSGPAPPGRSWSSGGAPPSLPPGSCACARRRAWRRRGRPSGGPPRKAASSRAIYPQFSRSASKWPSSRAIFAAPASTAAICPDGLSILLERGCTASPQKIRCALPETMSWRLFRSLRMYSRLSYRPWRSPTTMARWPSSMRISPPGSPRLSRGRTLSSYGRWALTACSMTLMPTCVPISSRGGTTAPPAVE